MKKHLFKPLLVMFCLIGVQLSAVGQHWVRITLDTVATIEFPAQPRAMGAFGFSLMQVNYDNGVYQVTVTPIGNIANTREQLDKSYQHTITGLTIASPKSSIVINDFTLHGLVGKDVLHHLSAGKTLYYHSRLLHVNGVNYTYSYTSEDSASLASERVDRFFNSLNLDTTVALTQYGGFAQSGLTTGVGIAGGVFGILLMALVLVVIAFVIRRLDRGRKSKRQAEMDK